MKRIQEDLRYDGATVKDVFAMLGTKEFREAVCDYQRVLHRTVTVNRAGETMSASIDQGHGTDRLPGFARKIVGEHINIVQTESWTDGANGQITVTVPGKPGEMTGTAGLPLIGGKVEGLIADMLRKALRAEHAVGVRWLAERRA